jgi:hypothetical protein
MMIGDWLVMESKGNNAILGMTYTDKLLTVFTRRNYRVHYEKGYEIRARDSMIVDVLHPTGNGLIKILTHDGYKMKIEMGSWQFHLRKLNTK